MSNDPGQRDNKAAWIIGVLAIVLVAFATYLNYGGGYHFGAATSVSDTRLASIN